MTATATRMLSIATRQFADKGYSGASMRSIAAATGTTQAAIYHHFPNKMALYEAALAQKFEEKTSAAVTGLEEIEEPEARLREFVRRIVALSDEDVAFRQLYLRELLESNPERLATLASNLFTGLTDNVFEIARQLGSRLDSHLFLLSILGLVCHHLEARGLAALVPDNPPENQTLDTLSEHISDLLLNGVRG